MAKSDVELTIGGDATGLLAALSQAKESVAAAAGEMSSAFSGLTNTFKMVSGAAVAMAAVFEGGKFFKATVDDTKKMTEDAINLGKTLGVSASQASMYGVAIESVGGKSEDFGSAIQTLTRQVKTHEGALNDMGIKTRDAGGNLRDMNDVFFDAVKVVNSYAEGMDRDLAAQTAFGRGAQASSAVFRLTKKDMAEAAVTAQELGLVVGKQNVEDFEANRKATAGAHEVMQGLEKQIGDGLLPILTHLGEWFRSVGPAAVETMHYAVATLVSVFWGVDVAVVAVWEAIKAMVLSVIGPLGHLGKAIWDLVHLDPAGAKAEMSAIATGFVDTWRDAYNATAGEAKLAAEKIKQAFSTAQDPADAPKKGKQFDLADPASKEKLIKLSNKYAEDEIRDANAILDAMKKTALEEAETHEETKLGEIAVSEKALQEQLKDGEISASQFLSQEKELIQKRLDAQREYYEYKKSLAVGDEAEQAAIDKAITKAEQKALLERQVAENQAHNATLAQWKQLGTTMENSFMSNIKGMLKGTETFGQAVRNLMASMVDGVLDIFVKMAVKWAENMILQTIQGKTAAASGISANASLAAVSAMASVAAIPYVGWAMAPEVAAATEADGMAYMAGLSASGGFDVPSGVNPVTQLHQKEMVLPANLADTIRGLAANGGAQGGGNSGGNVTVQVSALDSRSVDQWLRSGGDKQIAQAMQRQYKQFNPNMRGN